MKQIFSIAFGFFILASLIFFVYWLGTNIFEQFKLLDTKIAVGILTASSTIIMSTMAIVLGKYYEKQKDIEAHYREKKVLIYDEFLHEFFKIIHSDEPDEGIDDLTKFLKRWQQKMILWGGQEVLSQYIKWMTHMKKSVPDAKTMYMTEDFFRAIRKDLGHKSNKLEKGTFIYLLLQNTDLFFELSKENPNITLAELAEVEARLQS